MKGSMSNSSNQLETSIRDYEVEGEQVMSPDEVQRNVVDIPIEKSSCAGFFERNTTHAANGNAHLEPSCEEIMGFFELNSNGAAKGRSMACDSYFPEPSPSLGEEMSMFHDFGSKPSYGFADLHDSSFDPFAAFCNMSEISVPAEPMCLVPTHFRSSLSTTELVDRITQVLEREGMSFDFCRHMAEFSVASMQDGCYSKLQVSLYHPAVGPDGNRVTSADGEKIVEVQRMGGDGFEFLRLFHLISDAVLGTNLSGRDDDAQMQAPTVNGAAAQMLHQAPLTAEEVAGFVEPLKSMVAPTASRESQLQGCQLLCGLIESGTAFHAQLVQLGCVALLLRLAMSRDLIVAQQALSALVKLTELTPDSLGTVWKCADAAFVDYLLMQLGDGPYYTQIRRHLGARLLAAMIEHASVSASSTSASSHQTALLARVQLRLAAPSELLLPVPPSRTPSDSSASALPASVPVSRQNSEAVGLSGAPLKDTVLQSCVARIKEAL